MIDLIDCLIINQNNAGFLTRISKDSFVFFFSQNQEQHLVLQAKLDQFSSKGLENVNMGENTAYKVKSRDNDVGAWWEKIQPQKSQLNFVILLE